MADRFFVYILTSQRNGTLYVGVTNNLNRRIGEHKARTIPGFTKRYGVDRLVPVEGYSTIDEARTRERRLKRWKREWKLELIEKTNPAWRDLVSEI